MSEIIPQKRCSKCKQFKPSTKVFFSSDRTHKDGLRTACKECSSGRTIPPRPIIDGCKQCTSCKEWKPNIPEYFHNAKENADGLRHQCKNCQNARRKHDYESRRIEENARARAYKASHRNMMREYNAMYYRAHQESELARRRKYRADHPDRVIASLQAYRATHKEQIRARKRRYYDLHAEQIRAYAISYGATHKEQRRNYMSVYVKSHPDQFTAYKHNRHAHKLRNGGFHTEKDIQAQYSRQHGKCYYCSKKVGKVYNVDHVVPLVKGGSNGPENLVIACPTCNRRKNAKLLHEWPEGGRLL